MIKHVVMWKLKNVAEGNTKLKNIEIIKDKLLKLKTIIHAIDTLEVGKNINDSESSYDLVLISTHQDKAALAEYINHPAHKDAASFIGKVVAERKAVDFEF